MNGRKHGLVECRAIGVKARSATLFALLVLAGLWLGAAQDTGAQAVQDAPEVTLTLQNVGASAWRVVALEGAEDATAEALAEVAALEAENPTLTLTLGTRYRFDLSDVNSSIHPLDFRAGDGTVLLAQSGREGSFEADPAVAFEADETGLAFTLTPELAELLAAYQCSVHGAMRGALEVVDAP